MGVDDGSQALSHGVVILRRGDADMAGNRDALKQLLRASAQG